ncbi:MAG: copper homeostasis protein CutC [Cytophagaceae bacterium]|nr:copper homeostasis protein CutC [Cytophagaceae bacterium]MBL0301765.1 copper homeostasis protein CutC [Cytophagaceae bacterium]
MSKKLLEICCYSVQSGKNAFYGGADRIELCGGRPEGGTTPSYGMARALIEEVDIPVFLMIRPRGGDFCYSESEIKTMLLDIEQFRNLNPGGFVFGGLTPAGDIDIETIKMLMDAAGSFPVTFHRAFDMCKNPEIALEQLIDLGIKNLLTSGQRDKAFDGIENLKKYKEIVGNRLQIMAGSGVNPDNIPEINKSGVDAFHFSASKIFEGKMVYRNPNVKMGDQNANEYLLQEADLGLIKAAKSVIEKLDKM